MIHAKLSIVTLALQSALTLGDGCPNSIWSFDKQRGACNPCGPPPMSASDVADWNCSANGDIALDFSGKDARRCMSFETLGSCMWQQKDMQAIQAQLDSSDCNGLWIAPLWIVGSTWKAPQHATGEIDIFERGCDKESGYLLSLGEKDPYILRDAWKEEGKPGESSSFTAFVTFDRLNDILTTYRCPPGSSPIRDGVDGCTIGETNFGYFARTAGETKNGEEYFGFISDVWNACQLQCGDFLQNSQCKFKVSNIKLRLAEGASMTGSQVGGACNLMLAKPGPALAPLATCKTLDAPMSCTCDAKGKCECADCTPCQKDMCSAKQYGILHNATWYQGSGLSKDSPWPDFQNYLYRYNQQNGNCHYAPCFDELHV